MTSEKKIKPKSRSPRSMTYADAGVNLSAWHDTKDRIARQVKSTFTNRALGKFGHFGGMFDVSFLKKYQKPVLVSSVDGVGTKLKIAIETNVHDTVGEDIVNHCINDILVLGAEPLFFLDYYATGKLSPQVMESVVTGLARACRESGVVLIGGETAEMPGMYQANDYDIAGTIVGCVDEQDIIDGSTVTPGDIIVGLHSNGLHTNGYSLARKIVTEAAGKKYQHIFKPTGRTFGQELLRPHRSYRPLLPLIRRKLVKGCAHLTGGGFQENIDRILPSTCDASINAKAWTPDPIFQFLQKAGNVSNHEAYRTFNMGIGMVLAVSPKNIKKILSAPELKGFEPLIVGEVVKGSGKVLMNF